MGTDGSYTFTVGKLGMYMDLTLKMQASYVLMLTQAILIGERASLIEFPSVLLPRGISLGSVVDIRVARNEEEEQRKRAEFIGLQDDILQKFGIHAPSRTWPTLPQRPYSAFAVLHKPPSL